MVTLATGFALVDVWLVVFCSASEAGSMILHWLFFIHIIFFPNLFQWYLLLSIVNVIWCGIYNNCFSESCFIGGSASEVIWAPSFEGGSRACFVRSVICVILRLLLPSSSNIYCTYSWVCDIDIHVVILWIWRILCLIWGCKLHFLVWKYASQSLLHK